MANEFANTPVIDFTSLKDRLDGDKSLFLELTDLFFVGFEESYSNLQSSLLKQDLPSVCKIAHTLKGALANLSAMRASTIAREIEKESRAGNAEPLTVLLPQFLAAIKEFQLHVNQVQEGALW